MCWVTVGMTVQEWGRNSPRFQETGLAYYRGRSFFHTHNSPTLT